MPNVLNRAFEIEKIAGIVEYPPKIHSYGYRPPVTVLTKKFVDFIICRKFG